MLKKALSNGSHKVELISSKGDRYNVALIPTFVVDLQL
jgi:hypothetical protein